MDHMDDFGDMGAAAKSYVASTPKGPPVPTPNIPGVTCPSREDFNPYRKKHGLMVWDASNPDAPVLDPYERFEDFRGISHQLLQVFRYVIMFRLMKKKFGEYFVFHLVAEQILMMSDEWWVMGDGSGSCSGRIS